MRVNRLMLGLAVALPSGVALGQNYVGDTTCQMCHQNMPEDGFFEGYMNSGHPWKVSRHAGVEPPPDFWPFSPPPPLPVVYDTQLEWSDVEYVIGNYFWKARFIDRDGFIYTGDADETTQWNLGTQEWVGYHAGELDKPFDCGRCHTTGYDANGGNQHGLPGLIGTWEEDGIRCEACHGPSSDHAANPFGATPPGGKDCAECHYRDDQFRMPWKGGFTRHHQQGEDLSHSAHKDVLTCNNCHNPHRSTVYNDGGSTVTCGQCHQGNDDNNFYSVANMEFLDCIDCHMPYMGKSGQNYNEFTGDIKGHLFRIMTEPIAAVDNVYDDGTGKLFWNQDANGDSAATLDYACLGCHIDVGDGLTLADASAYATGIHTRQDCPPDYNGDGNVNSQDFIAFLNDFVVQDPAADYNGDGNVNSQDFIAFLNDFVAGC